MRFNLPSTDHEHPKLWKMLSALRSVPSNTGYWTSSRPILAYCAPCPVNAKARPVSVAARVGFPSDDLRGSRLDEDVSASTTPTVRQSMWLRRSANVKAS